VAGWFAYWRELGNHFVERLIEEVEPDGDVCKIVEI